MVAHQAEIGIPVGSWRSVGTSFNGFFHECFLDEVAVAGKVDPVAMRRKLMADFPAAMAVVDKVAGMAKWGEALPAGHAKGFAFTLSFGSWVGEIVEVADTPSGIRIEKVWIAADVGTALDPGIIEAQLVSGAIYGMSSAMGQEITFADGMVEQSNFHDYDAMRINQCPAFEVAILRELPPDGRRRRSRHAAGGCGTCQCGLGADRQARPLAADLEAGRVSREPAAKHPDICRHSCGDVGCASAEEAAGATARRRTRPRACAEWDKIYAVFSHPRCANCHVADDRPRWSGAHYGVTRVHGFNVQRGDDGSGFGNPGLRCTTCHFSSNSSKLHGPPGAETWHLAPAEMVWWQISSAEICAQIKDPRAMAAARWKRSPRMSATIRWSAGDGIPAPAANRLPGSADETYRAIENWAAAGAPCPSD